MTLLLLILLILVLLQVDFNSLSWHTIFLVGGGNVLGKAVSSSGLLGYISADITDGRVYLSGIGVYIAYSGSSINILLLLLLCLLDTGFSLLFLCFLLTLPVHVNITYIALPLDNPWVALVIILLFCLTAATFVSHTVASLILMPLISTLGVAMGMPEIAVIGSAFASKYIERRYVSMF